MFLVILYLFLFQTVSQQKIEGLQVWTSDAKKDRGLIQVWDIAKDAEDRLILALTPQFLEFNGSEFTDIISLSTRSLAADSNKVVFWGAESDFGYFDVNNQGRLVPISLKNKFFPELKQFGSVFDTHVIGDRVYFRSPSHLFLYHDNSMKIVIQGKALHRTYPFQDQLFVTIRGESPVFVKDTVITPIKGGENYANELFYSGTDLGSVLLLGTRTTGFYHVTPNGFTSIPFAAAKKLSGNGYYNAELLPDSILTFATKEGVLFTRLDGSIVGIINTDNGLPENNVLSLKYEAPNSLWIGMGSSLARLEYPQALITFKLGEGIDASNFSDIIEYKNQLFAGTGEGVFVYSHPSDAPVSIFNEGEFKRIDQPNTQILGFYEHQNELYVGTIEGLYKGDGKAFEKLNAHYTRKLIADSRDDNYLWLGTNNGLVHFNLTTSEETKLEGLNQNEEILSIIQQQDSLLWLGTVAGSIYRINLTSNQVRSWLVTEFSNDTRLYPIALSNFENKIRAHVLGGMIVYDEQTNSFINEKDFYDRFNLEKKAIYRLYSSEELVLYEYDNRININVLKTAIPFHKYPIRTIDLPTAAVFGKNYIWTKTISNIAKFIFPPVEIKIDYKLRYKTNPFALNREKGSADTVFIKNGNTIPFDFNNLHYEFDISSFNLEDDIKFRTRLVGFDSKWSDWNTKKEMEYSYLPSGDYIIEVEAKGRYGESKPIYFAFTIDQVWYLKPLSLFIFTVLILGFLSILGVFIGKSVRKKELANYEQKLKEEETERREKELSDAREFQMSLLPKKLPQLSYFETQVLMKTATEVGGDYYDFFNQDSDELIAVIGDASGHGTTAGMMVQITKAGLISNIKQHTKPDLSIVNDIFLALGQRRVKMSLTMLDISKDVVRVIMAAMPPIFWYQAKSNTCIEVLDNTVPMGSRLFKPGNPIDIAWEKGDILILISDGLPEWKNAKEEELGYDKIKTHILKHKDKPLDELLKTLLEVGEKHANGIEADDDITLLVFKKTT